MCSQHLFLCFFFCEKEKRRNWFNSKCFNVFMVILSMYFVTTPSLRGLKIASHDEVSPHTRSVRFVLKICVHTPINRVPPVVHPNVGSEPFVLVNAGFGANGTKLLVLNVSLLKLTNTMGIEENNCHNYDRLKR